MSEELLALAARLEAAEGPDRELDVLIAIATDWRWDDWEDGEPRFAALAEKHGMDWAIHTASGGMSIWRNLPAFSASLDSAMSLVPDAPRRLIEQQTFKSGAEAEPERSWVRIDLTSTSLNNARGEARAATLELALCSAALKARATLASTESRDVG